ncbi:hexameric tyrosine-coordinated heme protein [Kitasatospora sp. NPDC091207]|uniref:hexameric tyrosine-coordinated heme protein n=1 Tax=Kitasatospora sp. NPDC091207 TaxID=3364083 RepID=UPI003800BA55
MNRVPDDGPVLVPGNTLITSTPEEGRALALTPARYTVHSVQPDPDVLQGGRPNCSTDPDRFIAAAHTVAVEFRTIAAAGNDRRP